MRLARADDARAACRIRLRRADQASAAFFFGEPLKVFGARSATWFTDRAEIYPHLGVTLVETVLAFAIGTVLGLAVGLWLALSPHGLARSSTPTSRR